MNGGNGAFALYYLIVIVAVAGSVIGMRQPIGKTLKMALAWIAVFGVGFILFSFRSDFTSIGQRLRAEALGSAIDQGATLRIPVADDGHFWVEAKVNGHALRFIIDSGASITTLSRRAAEAARVPIGNQRTVVNTANGPASAIKGYADRLAVGSIERTDFPVDINEHDDTNLLGMNFLSSLKSWRVEGNYLVLES
ncbi:MAG: TIGR02281 family clan AA aspartic protease [Pseudomonadota bacterium]